MVSIVVIKHQEQKQYVDERVYLSLQLSDHTLSVREVRAETEAKATEELALLSLPVLLYH